MDLEATLLKALEEKALEEKVREMFYFTGWEEDLDDDAAQAVVNVEAVLHDLSNWRLLKQRYLSDSASGDQV